MAKKADVTPGVRHQIESALEDCSSKEEELDVLLSLHRGAQSRRDSSTATMAYTEPMIIERMKDLGLRRRVTKTRLSRTLGILTYPAKALTGKTAAAKARKIRRLAKPYLTTAELERLVTSRRTVTWKVDSVIEARLPDDVRRRIRKIRGDGKVKLESKPTTKKARRGDLEEDQSILFQVPDVPAP